MAAWKYAIRVIHLDKDGNVKQDVELGGPHDLIFTGLQSILEASLVELEPLPSSESTVRLKLTLKDKA